MDENTKKYVCKVIDEKFAVIIHKLTKIDDLEKSVDFLSNSYDALNKKFQALEQEQGTTKQENTITTRYLNNATNDLNQLKKDLNEMEQYIRRECLEIRGVPTGEDEDTNEIIRKIADLVDVDIDEDDISISHRLPIPSSKPGTNKRPESRDPPIIVRFVRREVRDELYKSRTKLRNKTTQDIGIERHRAQKIFIAESLTRRNHQLLNLCLQKKRELNYKFLWTKYGKVLMRKDGSSPVISIATDKDLDKLS